MVCGLQLSDLSFDATDLILIVRAGPLCVGLTSQFQTSSQAWQICCSSSSVSKCIMCHVCGSASF
jgi:hypothetical protein